VEEAEDGRAPSVDEGLGTLVEVRGGQRCTHLRVRGWGGRNCKQKGQEDSEHTPVGVAPELGPASRPRRPDQDDDLREVRERTGEKRGERRGGKEERGHAEEIFRGSEGGHPELRD
jgi:hypothetical protein